MKQEAVLKIKQEWECWMNIANPDMSIEQAVKKLKELGNEIIEIDIANRRIKILHITKNQ